MNLKDDWSPWDLVTIMNKVICTHKKEKYFPLGKHFIQDYGGYEKAWHFGKPRLDYEKSAWMWAL